MTNILLITTLTFFGSTLGTPVEELVGEPVRKPSGPSGYVFPPECEAILMSPTSTMYPADSVAQSLNTFCPVSGTFVDCLDRNQALLTNSISPVMQILGVNFNKTELMSKMNAVCFSLGGVADDLECFKKAPGSETCGLIIKSKLNSIKTLAELCKVTEEMKQCFKERMKAVCPSSAVEFYGSYTEVFVPNCNL